MHKSIKIEMSLTEIIAELERSWHCYTVKIDKFRYDLG